MQHRWVMLFVLTSDVETDELFNLHLFQNVLLSNAIRSVSPFETMTFDSWYKAVVETECFILVFDMSEVI